MPQQEPNNVTTITTSKILHQAPRKQGPSFIRMALIFLVLLFVLCGCCFVSIFAFTHYQDRYYRNKVKEINERVIDQSRGFEDN